MTGGRGRRIVVALAAGAALLAAAASADAAVTHVDCGASPAGADGTRAHPLTTLEAASSIPLAPGAKVLLRSGTECAGTLDLTGSGSKPRPALVGRYGEGDRPLITATDEDAVRLTDTAHTTIEGLELTAPGDNTGKKRGVHLIAAGRTVPGVRIHELRIHDVGGNLDKDGGGSGGIQVDAEGEGGSLPPPRHRRQPDHATSAAAASSSSARPTATGRGRASRGRRRRGACGSAATRSSVSPATGSSRSAPTAPASTATSSTDGQPRRAAASPIRRE